MRTERLLQIVGALAILGSFAVLAGWMLDNTALIDNLPNEANVVPNSAFGYIFCGIALFLLSGTRKRSGNYLLAAACLLIFLLGGIPLLEYVTHYNTGIDEIFRPLASNQTNALSMRMAVGTSMSFALIGPAFFLIGSLNTKLQRLGQYMLNAVTLIAILGVLGYLYRAPALYHQAVFTPSSIRNILSFLIMSFSASMLHPDMGFNGIFFGRYMGNVMARRLIPATVLGVFLLGFSRLESMRLHLINDQLGIILVFIAVFIFSFIVIYNTAMQLNGIDMQRISAKEEVDNLNENLKRKNEDISAAMQKLEFNNQYLEQLAYISSHDIKSPILTLKGLAEALEKEKAVKEEYREMFSMITGTVNQMQRTNNSLNSILKLRKNLLSPEADVENTDTLRTIIEDVKTTLGREIEEAKATFELNIAHVSSSRFPYVHMRSVVYNLISNSLKYRDNSRPLIIKISGIQTDKGIYEFTFEDTGIGIDTNRNKEKLFGIFKRFHDHVEGSGIGLHIIKSIVEAYGGHITLVSEPGKGSCFTIKWHSLTFA